MPRVYQEYAWEVLGFASYDEYLQSNMWYNIRRRVIKRANKHCECCCAQAQHVHHFKYSLAILRGEDLSQLVALCERCHHDAHYREDGSRRSLRDANDIIKKSMGTTVHRLQRPKKAKHKAKKTDTHPNSYPSTKHSKLSKKERRRNRELSKAQRRERYEKFVKPAAKQAQDNLQAYRERLRQNPFACTSTGNKIPARAKSGR